MSRLILSLWLIGAGVYTASTLLLTQPFFDGQATGPVGANETVRAKQPLATREPASVREDESQTEQAGVASEAAGKSKHRNEWVQVAGYTAVVRSRPSVSSPVLFAYPVGRPLRVIDREAGFARVQDLGSGQLGWMQETSLAPFIGGYRQREMVAAAPRQAAEPPQAVAELPEAAAAEPPKRAAVSLQARRKPFALAPQETAEAPETAGGSFFGFKRQRPAEAQPERGDSLAAIMDRAFRPH